MKRSALHPRRRAFTLIEAAMTTVIIGVGVLAMLELLAAGTKINVDGAEKTTAVNLAKNIREMTLKVPFAQLRALDNTTYNAPIDSRGVRLEEFSDWTQKLTVQVVDPDRLTSTMSDPSPDALHLTATVKHNGYDVVSIDWFAFDGTP